MLVMYNQYIKNSINNSDAKRKCVICFARHDVGVRHQIQRRMVSGADRLEFNGYLPIRRREVADKNE
ncbi:MAG: hypothetical protein WBZ36_05180 [Candidatus Nitrosopolaris sp.]